MDACEHSEGRRAKRRGCESNVVVGPIPGSVKPVNSDEAKRELAGGGGAG